MWSSERYLSSTYRLPRARCGGRAVGGDLNPFRHVQQHVLVLILIVKHLSHTKHPSHTHDARQRGVDQKSKEEWTQEESRGVHARAVSSKSSLFQEESTQQESDKQTMEAL